MHPLGMLYIASYLRKHADENINFKYTDRDYEKAFKQFKPDIVFMTTVSSYYNTSMQMAKLFKSLDKDVPIVVGGRHISALPQTMTNDMDVAVIGEGEETVKELLLCVDEPHTGIKGIAYRRDGALKVTEQRPLILSLDNIPLPARDIVSHLIRKNEFTDVATSRGCPYKCVFCSNFNFWHGVRFHSAERVVAELKDVSEKYTRKISVVDDTFTLNIQRLRRIVELVHNEHLDLQLSVSARTDTFTDEVASLLAQLGVKDIMFGFESGTQRMLSYLKCNKVKVEDNYRAIEICKKHSLRVFASIVIGSPDETQEEILESLKFAKTDGIWMTQATLMTPLPDTPMWDYALKKGFVNDKMDWSALNYSGYNFDFKKLIVLSETLSKTELLDLWTKFGRIKKLDLFKAGLKDPQKGIDYAWHRVIKPKILNTAENVIKLIEDEDA